MDKFENLGRVYIVSNKEYNGCIVKCNDISISSLNKTLLLSDKGSNKRSVKKKGLIHLKINETSRIGAINQYMRNTDAKSGNVSKKARMDEVSISPEAMEMLDAQERASKTGKSERIADLKKSVATGTYHVDADKIAEKLLPHFRK